jgi:hypothetical protein
MFQIKDDRFTLERSDAYELLLEIQRTRFRLVIKSGAENLYLEDHFLGLCETESKTLLQANKIMEEHPFLTKRTWKEVFLFSDFQIHTLLPSEMGTSPEQYLPIAYPTAPVRELDFSYVPLQKQILHFASLKAINQTIRGHFPNLQLSSSTATSLHYTYRAQSDVLFLTDTFADSCTYLPKAQSIAVKRVLLSDLDSLSSHKNALAVFGEVTPYSPLFERIVRIFPEAKIGEWNREDELSNKYSKLAQHRYFSLLAFNGFSE